MTFIEAIKSGFKNWNNFSDRSRRSEFWYWTLFAFLIGFTLSLIDGGSGTLSTIASLVLLVPNIAISTRRLHDVNRSGWWLLLVLTGIGVLVLLYWYVQPSNEGSNEYGAAPLPPPAKA